MRVSYLVLLLPIALGGCLSFSSTPTPQTVVVPPGTTVVPSGSTAVCANGTVPPC